jgi:hypothetical protein
MNRSVLDTINNPTLFFHPNEIVPPRILSRGKYVYNNESKSPVIRNEEEDLFKNKKFYRNSIQELNLYRPLHNRVLIKE